ncbi:MAG: zinc transporter [Halocynthiibacter sp.]|jgi:zinc transporter
MDDLIKYSYALNGAKAGQKLGVDKVGAALEADALAWAHLSASDPRTRPWIEAHLDYLDPHAIAALLAEETRPRATVIGEGVLLILRGVNLNEGADPEDMVSVRIWADPHRIVTLSRRRVRAVEEMAALIDAGEGPQDAATFLALITENLDARIENYVRDLDGLADGLEEELVADPSPDLRHRIVDARLNAITFRRYVSPQREAIGTLMRGAVTFIDAEAMRRFHEAHDRLTRLMEDLDAMRERMVVLREELMGQQSERLNRNMYVLSLISAVFLPLGFLTGLFGINLAGMPGAENPMAFWAFVVGLFALSVGGIALLRWSRWF